MPVKPPTGWIRHCYRADDIALTIDTPEACFLSEHSDGETIMESGVQSNLHDAAVAPLLSAIALAEQETLLHCVSQWLGKELDWQESAELHASLPIDVTLSRHSASEKVGLSFVAMHSNLPEFPSTLKTQYAAKAHRQRLSVCLSEIALGSADQNRLGPGCCVLLPNTFANSFAVSLFNETYKEGVLNALLNPREHTARPLPTVGAPNNADVELRKKLSDEPECSISTLNNTAQDPQAMNRTVLRFVLDATVEIDVSQWMQFDSSTTDKPDKPPEGVRDAQAFTKLAGQSVRVEQRGMPSRKAKLIRVGDGFAALFDNDW